ncbi:MAG: hypothetical protein EOP85_10650 [Verrucomicrobiaceae bacterium]|nr:MAG: hypothetical protein EOP85_10650 [Verrucomicrobiaceae bacterium]
MQRSKNTPFQITKPNYREPLSGEVKTPMAAGSLVELATTAGDARELVAANGGRFAVLELDVLSQEDWDKYCLANPKWRTDLRHPVPVGSTVTARFFYEAEFEGAAWFTGIDGTTAPKALGRTAAGKFTTATVGTHLPQIRLQRKVTPDDGASFRWLVENLD